ncbi:ATP-binding protein [Peterkaempfera bronchialis]|uniref:ATP-binding protein n=1 Tax=Peterkaempfera bronchialis TaxID=2126346 RepID=UPI0026AFF68A|nr:ATP-binding protein [Peterkaempfera bronchialis]
MSLPLTRRIAQAALLVAAGAAPVVATAGTASAAELPRTADLGGLTQLDSDSLAGQVRDVAHQTGKQAGGAGSSAVAAGVPTAADTLGTTAAAAIPEVNRFAGSAAEQAGATASTTGGMASDATQRAVAPVTAGSPLSALTGGGLPTGQLTGGLPLGGLDHAAGGASHRLGGLPDLGSSTGGLGGLDSLTSLIGSIGGAATQGTQGLHGGGSPLQGLPL